MAMASRIGVWVCCSIVACGGGRDGGDGAASAEGDATSLDGSGPTTGGGDGSGEVTADSQGPTTAATDPDSSGADSGDIKWDVGNNADVGRVSCEACGQAGSSYIYIANSNASMMSKINTETMIEEGRYLTRNGGGGSPSRTSVSIDGQLASINNRNIGGVLTVWSSTELCDPNTNGQPGLQTSTGPGDVLPWGQDDCVAWYTEIPGMMRPIAWTAGVYNEDTCQYENQKLWTATSSQVTAYRLDRDTGVIEDMASAPQLGFGYGGAADSDGNFWMIDLGVNLVRVDAVDLSVQHWVIPNNQSVYGITVASDGRVWMSANMSQTTSAVRFTPGDETFDFATGPVAYAQSGIVEDAMGRMWMNDWNSPYKIYPIDKETMVTGAPFTVTGATSSAKGIAVDKDGNVWTAHFDNFAYRMDVEGNVVESVGGLDYPYTYSDMTGSALTGVTCGSPTG